MADLSKEWQKPDLRTVPSGPDDKLIVPAPSNPMAVTRTYLDDFWADARVGWLLRHHRNTWHAYDDTSWPELEDRSLRSDLYNWLAPAWYWKKTKDGDELVEWEPTEYKIRNVIDALRAHSFLDGAVTAPAWIGGEDLGQVVPMSNGLLTVATRKLIPHTPAYFSPHVLPFAYDPTAPKPARWLQFLEEVWEDDVESPQSLAEILGYIVGGSTRQQKIFMLVGPLRSGKGTIGRVLAGLLGAHNVAAPTLAGMTTNFGLQELVGKPLALISDARLGNRTDGTIAVERLLSISGEDSITIDRKYKDHWTGQLPTRFLVLTNEIPRFTDASGALASRFIVLVMTKSFFGQEDPALTSALLAEAPGIFNWALDGLDRLNARGYFEMPLSARAAMQRLQDLASPVSAFVRDRCVIDPVGEINKDTLWDEWKDWCLGEGKDRAGTKSVFGRDLFAAYPGLKERKLRDGSVRVRVYDGIRLSRPADDPDDGLVRDRPEQLTGPRTTPDQTDPDDALVRDAVQDGEPKNRRSEGVVRGGPGSSALYSLGEDEPLTDRLSPAAYVVLKRLVDEGKGDWGTWRLGMSIASETKEPEYPHDVIAAALADLSEVPA